MRLKVLLRALFAVVFAASLDLPGQLSEAAESKAADAHWEDTLQKARGQTVYWNAWGGDERINAYIAWVGERLWQDREITVRHVKLADTADAVSRVLAEKTAGRDNDGSIDLIWINGENFATMKQSGLLHGPFAEALPNFALVDTEDKPTTQVDFTVPVEGFEAPWGMAKFNFIYDSARVAETPASIPAFLTWAQANPGRFTYPAPPDFLGSTFLKQVLIELAPDPDRLQRPVADPQAFAAVTAPLWAFLEDLAPNLWRKGEIYPATGPAQRQLLDDGEVDITLSFYPSDASSFIANDLLPESARIFVLDGGTIGNTHFVAIPYNARATAAAEVVANFLMSPEAQAHKQNLEIWGDQTVLDLDKLAPEGRARFEALPRGAASLAPQELGPTLLEPHPSWMTMIEAEWRKRFSR